MVGNSINRALLLGQLRNTPVLVPPTEGTPRFLQLSLVTTESWQDGHGVQSHTEVHRVAVFDDELIERVQPHLTGGAAVLVEAPLYTRRWVDQIGQAHSCTWAVVSPGRGRLVLDDVGVPICGAPLPAIPAE